MKQVLIIDDSPMVLKYLRTCFIPAGHPSQSIFM
jgi:hypothetical protein